MKKTPLPPDALAGPALKSKLKTLSLRPQAGTPSARVASGVSGKTYLFPANDDKVEAVTAEFGAEGAVLVIEEGRPGESHPVWPRRVAQGLELRRERGVAEGRSQRCWTADDIFTARLAAYETPFIATMALQFKGDELLLNADTNVGFGQTKRPELVGRRTAAAD